MKTIDELVREHKAFEPMEKLPSFFIKWTALSFVVLAAAYVILPLKPDLAAMKNDFIFHVENVLWLVLSVSSALALYYNSFPDNRTEFFGRASIFFFSMLFTLTFYHNGYEISLAEAAQELSFFKGRCGFIITFLALIHSAVLVYWAKKGAPASPGFSAFRAGVSASSLGCFLMQVVCLHDNTLHLIIWHFLPLAFICFWAQKVLGKKLRW